MCSQHFLRWSDVRLIRAQQQEFDQAVNWLDKNAYLWFILLHLPKCNKTLLYAFQSADMIKSCLFNIFSELRSSLELSHVHRAFLLFYGSWFGGRVKHRLKNLKTRFTMQSGSLAGSVCKQKYISYRLMNTHRMLWLTFGERLGCFWQGQQRGFVSERSGGQKNLHARLKSVESAEHTQPKEGY